MTDSVDAVTDSVDALVLAPPALSVSESHMAREGDPVVIDPAPVDAVAQVSDALADAAVSQLSTAMPNLTAEQVKAVVAALNTVQSGDEVGSIRRSPEGVFAIRISVEGVHKWAVVNPADGSMQHDNENSRIMTWPTVP